jgi:hypothetical protein
LIVRAYGLAMKIKERRPYPRGGHRRRVLWSGRTYVCFNCRLQIGSPDGQLRVTDGELGRLRLYRAAVTARVYSDQVAACR